MNGCCRLRCCCRGNRIEGGAIGAVGIIVAGVVEDGWSSGLVAAFCAQYFLWTKYTIRTKSPKSIIVAIGYFSWKLIKLVLWSLTIVLSVGPDPLFTMGVDEVLHMLTNVLYIYRS